MKTQTLQVNKPSDLIEIAKGMASDCKRNSDLKDLIVYFERDNNFHYKARVKIWDDMNVYEMPKTKANILKLLQAIVDANKETYLPIGTKIYAVHKNYEGKPNGIIRIGKIATYLECNGNILPVSKATDGKGDINVLTHTFYTDLTQAINAIKTK